MDNHFDTLNDHFRAVDRQFNGLQNLVTDVHEFHAKDGSNTIFDFNKGDPLATTTVNDLHKDKGAQLSFAGATANQQQGVTGRFLDGS